ncbi:MAG: alpha/beta fold hydrolase [Pseudomonadaceae bacterium]|nr:alpha/beta fold hydrolase [Pseudomonadaceae bacterium]
MDQPLSIAGDAGNIEARLTVSENPSTRGIAVLCHPHPTYGGSMFDAVLDTAASALSRNGYNCLRFNFRGVGTSDGAFDAGVGEQRDVVCVVDYARAQPNGDHIVLVGYSFGAAMAWNAASHAGTLDQLLLIAPPTSAMEFDSGPPPCPATAIYGSQDDYVSEAALASYGEVIWRTIERADHFFTGEHEQLATLIDDSLLPA